MFKSIFSFEGRIRRLEYSISFIIYSCIPVFFIFTIAPSNITLFSYIVSIPFHWFLWAQGAKRCHDINKSGWWQLIPFYPIYLIFKDGDINDNQYGTNPKGTSNDISKGPEILKSMDSLLDKKNKLYKLKLDGFLTEAEYNDKINLLDTQERVDNELKKVLSIQ